MQTTQTTRSLTRRAFFTGASAAAALALAACTAQDDDASEGSSEYTAPTGTLAFDTTAWNYDDDNDVWWQVGVCYCETPATTDYETLGIYVPGAYLDGEENDDGTYTCTVSDSGEVSGHTAADAPIVIPVNTAGYSAQEAPTSYSYSSVSDYLEAGFVYVYPGCRGRANGYDENGDLAYAGGAPWGVTDLKAAVRYLRYNRSLLPGDTDAIFTFGHSGGGAQSALMGVSGDSEAYEPYLEIIGAAGTGDDESISDAIAGAMCWCPITCLDGADAAYEWMMGQFSDSGVRAEGTWTAQLSRDLANAYPSYLSGLNLVGSDGSVLELESSDEGYYLAGSYYDEVVALVERSLNNFLEDTEFPYTPSSETMADGGFGAGLTGDDASELPDDDLDDSELPDNDLANGELPDADLPDGDLPDGDSSADTDDELPSGDLPGDASDGSSDESSVTYETAAAYIASLNADSAWVSYDEDANTATVLSLEGFVNACKQATKDIGAFDQTDRSQAENDLFGNADEDSLHFDSLLTELLENNADTYAAFSDWDETLPDAYAGDLELVDDAGLTVPERVELYEPLAYLCDAYSLCGTTSIAPHWRIRTGIEQGDTSLCTELNLALALEGSGSVSDVDFETVWGKGHTTAERTGDSTENFISWVEECLA